MPLRLKSDLNCIAILKIFQAFNQSSPGAIFKHQLGGLELLRLRTPYRHRTGLDQSLFIDLRMFWVCLLSFRFLFHEWPIH